MAFADWSVRPVTVLVVVEHAVTHKAPHIVEMHKRVTLDLLAESRGGFLRVIMPG